MNTDLSILRAAIDSLSKESEGINSERRTALYSIAAHIAAMISNHGICNVIFVCTHNSRRSQLAEAWMHVLTAEMELTNLRIFSAGTEATGLHPNMAEAMMNKGFRLQGRGQETYAYDLFIEGKNEVPSLFSKTIDHPTLPKEHVLAIMVCDDAYEHCPFVPGAQQRISLSYEDPKRYDDHVNVIDFYEEKVMEIGREMVYLAKKILS